MIDLNESSRSFVIHVADTCSSRMDKLYTWMHRYDFFVDTSLWHLTTEKVRTWMYV